jgi:hypothetical protein
MVDSVDYLVVGAGQAGCVEGLRVVDASIRPRVISGNTQALCAMIGEKAAGILPAASHAREQPVTVDLTRHSSNGLRKTGYFGRRPSLRMA